MTLTRSRFCRLLPCLFLLAITTTVAVAGDKKRVLLLGDSISIGYTPFVQSQLAEEALVLRPTNKAGKAENCGGTTAGVQHLDRWLGIEGGKWDIIHFNWGLHDLKHVKPGQPNLASDLATDPPQASLEVYEKQLREIVGKLKATGAKLIFATTTYVPEGPHKIYRTDADVVLYNTAALKVMQESGITVNDLYAASKANYEAWQRPVNVHFTDKGSEELAKAVVTSIKSVW